MSSKAETPMTTLYHPEFDVIPDMDPIMVVYCMSLIGMLRWMVEFGRVDICLEISMVSSHIHFSREGHLDKYYTLYL